MYLAGFIVAGFIVAGVYAFAWLRGRRDRYHRAALIVPLTVACLAAPVQLLVGDWAARTVAEKQPTKLAAFEGLEKTTEGRRAHPRRDLLSTARPTAGSTIPDLLSLLAFHDPNATVAGPRRGARPTTARRSASSATRSRRWSASGRALAALAASFLLDLVPPRAAAPLAVVLPRRRGRGPARGRRADRGLDHDRGRPPAVDRLRGDADRGGGHRRRRDPGRLRDPRGRLRRPRRACVLWLLRRLARNPVERELPATGGRG